MNTNSVKNAATSWFARVPLAGKICAVLAVVCLFFLIFPFASVPEDYTVYKARVIESDGELILNGFDLPRGLKAPDYLIDQKDEEVVNRLFVRAIVDGDENVYITSRLCPESEVEGYLAAEIASRARKKWLVLFLVFAVAAAVSSIPNVGEKAQKLWSVIAQKGKEEFAKAKEKALQKPENQDDKL